MATKTITGTGAVTSADFKSVSWKGVTKGGKDITITLTNAINMGNIDWTFAEKNDTVPAITFTACYTNTDEAADDTTEPWSIEVDDSIPGTQTADTILLGAGVFYIGSTAVALTRGGGSFNVARTYRQINADGDRGPVSGRIEMTDSTATLTMNVLTMLGNMSALYSSINVSS